MFARPQLLASLALLASCAPGDPPPRDRASDPPPHVEPSPPPRVEPTAEPTPSPEPTAEPTAEPPTLEPLPAVASDASGPPDDFGAIRPPIPPPADPERTVHALAGFEVVAVHALPDLASPRLGYLRIGARTLVTPKIDDRGSGCPKGFHALAAGGFVCASKGLVVDAQKPPYLYMPPPPPRIDAPIPYDYGVIVADGTPMWWRIPDADEVTLAAQKYRAIVDAAAAAAAAAAPPPAAAAAAPPPAAAAPSSADASPTDAALPSLADPEPPVELTAEEKAEQARREAAARRREAERKKREAERDRALARKRARLPLNSQTPFMEAGFVVTLADKVKQANQTWWKTTRGGYVQASRIRPRSTQDFHGGELPEGARAAFGFVEAERGTAAATLAPDGTLKWKRRLAHRQLVAFAGEAQIGGRTYLVTPDGLHVRPADLRLAAIATRPDGVAAWERWIDVDLGRQLLVAYEGDEPVYATLISSGRRGTAEESFATPTGEFRITAKHVSSSMDGNTASDGRYSIQDVPWAMFFSGNYALHGAFWHQKFGERRSHGCINLGPTDARWLFFWTTPRLPDGWHGVNAHDGAPGSMVVIHG